MTPPKAKPMTPAERQALLQKADHTIAKGNAQIQGAGTPKPKAPPPPPAKCVDLKKANCDVKGVIGGKNSDPKPTPKPVPKNVGVGPNKTVMTSDERVRALNFDARVVQNGNKYTRIPNFMPDIGADWKYKPKGSNLFHGNPFVTANKAGLRSDGGPTRVAGKPNQKPVVPQPPKIVIPR